MNEEKKTDACKCMKEVAEKIKEHVSQTRENQNGFAICGSRWENESLFPINRLYANFLIESTFVKKDGTISKPKNSHVSAIFSYCPFCGKPYPEKKNIKYHE